MQIGAVKIPETAGKTDPPRLDGGPRKAERRQLSGTGRFQSRGNDGEEIMRLFVVHFAPVKSSEEN
jgi:hypothetical protein